MTALWYVKISWIGRVKRILADILQWFPISTKIDGLSGISSFTVAINLADGTTRNYDNNGNSYPMSDATMLQIPQSCLLQGSGALTVSALVSQHHALHQDVH